MKQTYKIETRWNYEENLFVATIREKPGNFLAAIVTGTTEVEVNEKAREWVAMNQHQVFLVKKSPRKTIL